MKKLSIAAVLLTFCAFGERNQEMHEDMEATDKAAGALRKMDKKIGPEAVRHAETIAGMYEAMIPFWRGRNSAAGTKSSEAGKNAAVQLVAAAHAGDAAAADTAFKDLLGTCKTCHDAHRERGPNGKFRSK